MVTSALLDYEYEGEKGGICRQELCLEKRDDHFVWNKLYFCAKKTNVNDNNVNIRHSYYGIIILNDYNR